LSFSFSILAALLPPLSQSFVLLPHSTITKTGAAVVVAAAAALDNVHTKSRTKMSVMLEEQGCTTESRKNYDIVNVDLSDDRDYPIYIGTGYEDKEGKRCQEAAAVVCCVLVS